MLIDIRNCVTILFVIIITFVGFILPGCKSADSSKESKSVKVKTARKDIISPSNKQTSKKSLVKKGKIDSKKQSKSSQTSSKENSKIKDEPKDNSIKSTCSNKKDEDVSKKEVSKRIDDKDETSLKEKSKIEVSKKVDVKDEASFKENSKKEEIKKTDDKDETSLKEISKKEEIKKSDDKNETSQKEVSLKELSKKIEIDDNNNDSSGKDIKPSEIKPSMEKIIFEKETGEVVFTLENKTDIKRAIKIKCSDNNIYKVDPVFQYIEPGQSIFIAVIRTSDQKKTDKLVIQNTPATLGGNDPHNEFKTGEKYSSIVVPLKVAN